MKQAFVIGADIGGTHITAAQIDMSQGMSPQGGQPQGGPLFKGGSPWQGKPPRDPDSLIIPGTEVRHHLDPMGDVDSIITAWARCIQAAAGGQLQEQQVCIAVPGPFDYPAGICLIKDQQKYPALYGLNVKQLLARKLGITPRHIFFHNDAACFLQGELFGGSLQGYQPAIGVTLGTGLGSATCRDSLSQDAGWWAYPFREGMAEDYLSTRWFVQRWQQLTGQIVCGVKELAALAIQDTKAQQLFAEFAHNFAQMLNRFIAKEAAKAVAIGGNIAQAFPLFKDQLLEEIQAEHPAVVIRVSQLGEKAALVGAAGSWQVYRHLPV